MNNQQKILSKILHTALIGCGEVISRKERKDSARTQKDSLNKVTGVLVSLFILFCFTGYTNAQTVNQSLKKIQNKFNSIANFSADFVQVSYGNSGKQEAKISGKFTYKRKNKFIVEIKGQMIISDGETTWNYNQRQKQVVIGYFSDDPTSFSLERYIFDYPQLCRVKSIKNGDEEIIQMIPKDDNLEFRDVKLWINPDNMIVKMELVDMTDMKYSFQFNNIQVDQVIPDSKFNFNPPKGTRIIDLR